MLNDLLNLNHAKLSALDNNKCEFHNFLLILNFFGLSIQRYVHNQALGLLRALLALPRLKYKHKIVTAATSQTNLIVNMAWLSEKTSERHLQNLIEKTKYYETYEPMKDNNINIQLTKYISSCFDLREFHTFQN